MKPTGMWHHCEQMTDYFVSLARDAAALATDHRRMAQSLK